MLFPYKYVPHQMDRMQKFINFIFYQVWCRAPKAGPFDLDLFAGNPDLKEVMEAFLYSDTKGAYFFYGHVEGIYQLFSKLSRTEIKQLKRWYQGNNNIQKVCENDPSTQIARYSDIPQQKKVLNQKLSQFFCGLYDNIGIAALKQKIGDIEGHYKLFMSVNKTGKCPFCGIADMQGVFHSTREAYDHYLPKGLYPFNSINFRNLVPACHHCNSSYKTSKDPAFIPKDPTGATHRRKVFYPFANSSYNIEVTIDLKKTDIDHLVPDDIQLAFGPPVLNEEIETWKDIYGIEERYKGKLIDGDGKAWLIEVLDEWKWQEESSGIDGRSPNDYLRNLKRHTEKFPFASSNFLKNAFLDGCDRAGLFSIKEDTFEADNQKP